MKNKVKVRACLRLCMSQITDRNPNPNYNQIIDRNYNPNCNLTALGSSVPNLDGGVLPFVSTPAFASSRPDRDGGALPFVCDKR